MSEGLLAIGAFSRASSLSIKALRNYHELGLLVPAQVDPRTGYRAYTVAQLADAAVLHRLRRLDLPLEDIGVVLAARDPAVTGAVLARHAARMQARLEDTRRIVEELQVGVERPAAHTPVHLRDEPAEHTLALRGRLLEDDFAGFLGPAFAVLGEAVARTGAGVTGPGSALYPPGIGDEQSEESEVVAFLPVAAPVALLPGSPFVNGEVPARRTAVATHLGSYDEIGDTYRALGAWVAANARPFPGGWVRERYLVGPESTDDPTRYRTEISWPVTTDTATPADTLIDTLIDTLTDTPTDPETRGATS